MSNNKKRKLINVLLIVNIILVLSIAGLFYMEYRSRASDTSEHRYSQGAIIDEEKGVFSDRIKSSIQVEAGSDVDISPYDFIIGDIDPDYDTAVTIETDLFQVHFNKVETHKVKLKVDGQLYNCFIEVVDTTPPVGETTSRQCWVNEPIEAIEFMTNIDDASSVEVSYKNPPNFSILGKQEVILLLEDTYNNKSEITEELEIIEDVEPPVFQGLKDITIYEGDTISYRKGVTISDNKDSDITYEIDSSNVNTRKPGAYSAVYTAEDSVGNKTEEKINVIVKENFVSTEDLSQLSKDILNKILKEGMTQREQAYEIYKWVKANIGYVNTSDKSDPVKAAYKGITNKRGDCFTYYIVSEVLLTEAGIDNMKVTRDAQRSSHYWNLVNCDGKGWYHFDTCPFSGDNADTFMLTDAQLEKLADKRGAYYHRYDKSLYPEVAKE